MNIPMFKYRGKRLDGNGWAYGDLVKHRKKLLIREHEEDGSWTEHEIDPATLGVSCVIQDKDIWVGDKIRCKRYVGGNWVEWEYETGTVGFKNGAFYLIRKEGYYRPLDFFVEGDWTIEIIEEE